MTGQEIQYMFKNVRTGFVTIIKQTVPYIAYHRHALMHEIMDKGNLNVII